MGIHEQTRSEIQALADKLRKSQLLTSTGDGGPAPPLPREDPARLIGALIRRVEEFMEIEQSEATGLVELNSRLHTIIESVPDGILTIADDDRVLSVNGAGARMFCMPANELVGMEIQELLPGYRDESAADCDSPGGVACKEIEGVRADGSTLPVELRSCTSREGDKPLSLAILRDISKRREGEDLRWKLEEDLRRSQKLEAVGQLAAGIAHEINTPAQFISDNTSFVRDSFEAILPIISLCQKITAAHAENGDTAALLNELTELMESSNAEFVAEEVPEAIEETLGGIARVTKIVSAMRQFSHPGSTEIEPADLNKAIQSTVVVSTNVWKYVAEMKMDLDESLPSVSCHLAEINQTVLNLIVNASHAIGDVVDDGEKGTITVATRLVGESAEISVTDTGTGIPAEVLPRIFDPFFTTKQVGKGTGQGLSLAHSIIVDRHGGTIDIETEQGKGTCFRIRIPLVNETPENPESKETLA